ncbi:MAG: heparan-alpha-glucosaminide N-acetyltransferase domain-containing protein [Flavobacteriaceae bacterium]|nr:heparan-alpha-glucosaminide N-acetyltransferase domain-containing protein [Flavobacteriaceae bacterium]
MDTNQRLQSLDVLRGLTIILMIIVNSPGSWSHVYPPLLHAEWNGLTPTDLVFPSFLFIVGISIVLSLEKRVLVDSKQKLLKKVFGRAIKIYLVGLLLWVWPEFDFSNIRYAGVLQRISIVYMICATIFIYTKKSNHISLGVVLLITYAVIMVFVPIPGIGKPDLSEPMMNWANYIDSHLLPGILWQKTWDPEGILSTIGAVVTGLFGMSAAGIIKQYKESKSLDQLMMYGFILAFTGYITHYIFPVNKALWSSSFTLLTAGISALTLGTCIYYIDQKKMKKGMNIPIAFGVNPIVAYTLSSLLVSVFYSDFFIGVALNDLFMETFIQLGLSAKFISLVYALIYGFIIFIPTYLLYKKKLYIKL